MVSALVPSRSERAIMHLHCEVEVCHLLGGTEENHIKPKSGYPVSRPGFESRLP